MSKTKSSTHQTPNATRSCRASTQDRQQTASLPTAMNSRRQPEIAVTLTAKQRDAVRDGALDSLLATDDLKQYLNEGNDPDAHGLAEQLADAAAVINALAWHPESTTETIILSLPRDQLIRALRRLQGDAVEALTYHHQGQTAFDLDMLMIASAFYPQALAIAELREPQSDE